jgi:cold-inducible RNA-binding protein
MSNKMYVGNIPFSATEADLRTLFSEFGQPTEVMLLMDRETGRPRGFGFVTMDSRDAMERTIQGIDGRDFQGRKIHVNEAKEREERPRVNTNGGGPRENGKRDNGRW